MYAKHGVDCQPEMLCIIDARTRAEGKNFQYVSCFIFHSVCTHRRLNFNE